MNLPPEVQDQRLKLAQRALFLSSFLVLLLPGLKGALLLWLLLGSAGRIVERLRHANRQQRLQRQIDDLSETVLALSDAPRSGAQPRPLALASVGERTQP